MSKNNNFKYTYFIDRSLGKSVGLALKNLGVKIEFHQDHFAQDSPDTEWLPIVSKKSWIVLTKDTNIGRNILEIQAMAYSNAKVFTLVSGNLKTSEMIDIFEKVIEKIDKIAQSNEAPFIAKIYKNTTVKLWKNDNELKKVLEQN